MSIALNEVSKAELEAALDRLQASPVFERSVGLVRLLRFLLQLAEESPGQLRETYIATTFFNRDSTYDPRTDSIVRVNLRRLRQRLEEFYVFAGADEPVRISIPVGAYRPSVVRAEFEGEEFTTSLQPSRTAETTASGEAHEPTSAQQIAPVVAVGATDKQAPGWRRYALWWAWVPVLLCGAAVAIFGTSRSSPAYRALTGGSFDEFPLTTGRDLEFAPSTSADGSRLAYVSRAGGSHRFQIFLRSFSPDSRDEHVLETGPENALYPAWSPDGREIAFLRCGNGPCDIAIVPSAGGPVRSVRTLPTYALPDDQGYYQYRQLNPVWTRDGTALIYPDRRAEDRAERLVIHDLRSGKVDQLTGGGPADEDAAPALSPDGRSVAFLRRHLDRTDVMTVDLASRATHVLRTEPNATTTGLTWATDGQGVVIGSGQRKGFQLLYAPLHGDTRPIDVKRPFPMNPTFAQGQNTLMFVAANRTRNLAEVAGIDGQPLPIFPSKQRNTFTALSPDGLTLAFLSDRSGAFELWLSKRSGAQFGAPRQLTHGLGWYPSSITWAPDERTLAVGISNSNEVQMVGVETGAIGHLRLPGLEHCDVWSPVWSADGRWIYLSAWGEKDGIFRASTGAVPAVEQIWSGRARELRLDGDRALYFAPNYGTGVYRLPLGSGAQPEPVLQLNGVQPSRAWLVADGKLLFMDAHEPVTRLRALDLASGKVEVISGPLPRVAFADGTLLYVSGEHLLMYSEWSEDAGSQILGLRWG